MNLMDMVIRLRTDTAELKRGVAEANAATKNLADEVRRNSSAMTTSFAAIGTAVAAAFSVRKLVEFGDEMLELRKTQIRSELRMAAVLRATGNAAGFSAKEAKQMAADFQDAFGIGDESILGTQAVLATFRNISGNVFKETIELAYDMSAVLGQDARSGAIQLGKALNDPIRGMTALRRVGVTFTADQEAMVKQLQGSNDLLGAQRVVLEELKGEFGGVAREMAGGFYGEVDRAKAQWGDFKENLAAVVTESPLVVAALGSITDALKSMNKSMTKEDTGWHKIVEDDWAERAKAEWEAAAQAAADARAKKEWEVYSRVSAMLSKSAAAKNTETLTAVDEAAWAKKAKLEWLAYVNAQKQLRSSGGAGWASKAQAEWEARARVSTQLRESAGTAQTVKYGNEPFGPNMPKDLVTYGNQQFEPTSLPDMNTYWTAQLEYANSYYDAVKASTNLWAEQQKTTMAEVGNLWAATMDNVVAGIGQGIGQAIVYNDDLGKSAKALWKSIASQTISSLTQIAIKTLWAEAVKTAAVQKESQMRTVAYIEEATAGHLASQSSSGWYAYVSAAAFLAAAVALIGTVSGQFHSGGQVPYDGSFYLKKGETVRTPDQERTLLERPAGPAIMQMDGRRVGEILLGLARDGKLRSGGYTFALERVS